MNRQRFTLLLALLAMGYSTASNALAAETANTQSVPHPVIGKASFYAHHFTGKKTASGERLNPNQLTAASKTLPLGTHVKVTNLKNGKTVHVTINDRGPYVRGRDIDLTPRAAEALAMRHDGLARVEIRPEPAPEQEADAALPSQVPPENN
jgi:rare lipoprotein A